MSTIPLFDLHQDVLLHMQHREIYPRKNHWQTNFDLLSESPIRILITTAFPHVVNETDYYDSSSEESILKDLDTYISFCKKNNQWIILENKQDLGSVKDSSTKKGMILHIEGVNTVSNTTRGWGHVQNLYEKGVRSFGPVWNISNALGGGTHDEVKGLTPFGEQFIEWVEAKNVILDCAHMNKQTFWDTVHITHRPLLVSHGGSASFCPNIRNYDDEQIHAIAQSNGVIGICCVSSFISKEPLVTIEHFMNHIKYLVNLAGVDHIAFGTDFGGIFRAFIKELDSVKMLEKLQVIFKQYGYSQEDTEKVFWNNAYRVITNHLSG